MSEARIEQFKKMAEADPDNELGHFSLGRAYLEAGRYAEAAASLERAISLNSNLSKAYQLLGESLLQMNQRDAAISRLSHGVQIADTRGDVLPRNEMMQKLKDLGAPLPEMKSAAASKTEVGQGEVLCKRCGRVAPKLPSAPFSSAQGKMIYENICAECWRAWIGMGTKVINELRLPLSDPQAQKVFDQHMLEFLNLK
ncbi:MAG TPA: Fe(2+)-trafficking protein [Tepidisphaeraceae bacterium]|jgi:Fe-S cluster biosynthesis and repair protein YggX